MVILCTLTYISLCGCTKTRAHIMSLDLIMFYGEFTVIFGGVVKQ